MKSRTLIITTIALAVIAFMCLEQGALWGSIVAGIVSVGVIIWTIGKWGIRQCRLHELFDAYYEQREKIGKHSFTIGTHRSVQTVKITLLMKANINIGTINLDFKSERGPIPEIQGLHDHNLGQAHPDFRWIKQLDDSWNCQVILHPYRNRGQRIRIGIELIALDLFNGYLEVFLSSEEGAKKTISLPFKVRKGWDDGGIRTDSNGDFIFPD